MQQMQLELEAVKQEYHDKTDEWDKVRLAFQNLRESEKRNLQERKELRDRNKEIEHELATIH